MIRPIVSLAAASLASFFIPDAAVAAAGDLDPTFGIGGKRNVVIPGTKDSFASAVVRDSAGRIYLIASVETATDENPQSPVQLSIARLHHDGSLDTSYGASGYVTPVMPDFYYVSAAVMQPDGKIVLGGSGGGGRILSCRMSRNGVLDASFGDAQTPGCVVVEHQEHFDVNAIALQPDGHIVLAGTGINVGNLAYVGFAARLTPAGQLAPDFGNDGIKLTNFYSFFYDVALASNGDLILAGEIGYGNTDFLIVRYDGKTGQQVPGFGIFGIVIAPFETGSFKHDTAFGVEVLADGGIVAVGYAQTDLPGTQRPAVLKLNSAGKSDESFGVGGKRIYDPCAPYPSGCEVWTYDIATLPGERLALTGSIMDHDLDNRDFLAMRILANGDLDASFGNDPQAPGSVVVPFDLGGQDGGWPHEDVAGQIMADGERLLLVGKANVATDDSAYADPDDFALARLDHGLDTTFIITPKPGPGGALSPATPQQVGHSDRAEFAIVPEPGFVPDAIEKGPGYCDGGLDGEVFVSEPVTQSCEVHLSFKRLRVFADGYE